MRSSRRTRLNADTSAEPEGLTRRVVLNFLEAFFRRPWLHLLPLILMLVLGGASAFSSKESFKSTGTITAESSTVLGDLTQSNNTGFNFETPATVVARNINELLRTTNFLNVVAGKLQADATDSQKALLRDVIAKDVGAIADGDQLVRVSAASERADLSFRLADAVIRSYVETVKAEQDRPERPSGAVLPGPGRRCRRGAPAGAGRTRCVPRAEQRDGLDHDHCVAAGAAQLPPGRPRPRRVAVRRQDGLPGPGEAGLQLRGRRGRPAAARHRPTGASAGPRAAAQEAPC